MVLYPSYCKININFFTHYQKKCISYFYTYTKKMFVWSTSRYTNYLFQERASLLYLRYISRWGRDRVRGYLVSPPAAGGRHCASITCPCQFIEEHLHCKPPGKLTFRSFFSIPNQPYNIGECRTQWLAKGRELLSVVDNFTFA